MEESGITTVVSFDQGIGKKKLVSPCAGVCILNTETKFCLGCYRTINEISRWQEMSADDQHLVMTELVKRRIADRGD